jgi:Uma2 family endonuclease
VIATESRPPVGADLLELIDRLGGIDPARVRLVPPPGTATVKDLIRTNDAKNGPACELIDGTLVEKGIGAESDYIAALIVTYLNNFVLPRNLGAVFGSRTGMKMVGRNVRLPDVAYLRPVRWQEWLTRRDAVVPFAADLAVEVLSKSNTRAEMDRKRREYFASGTRLVWEVNPRRKTVSVYTSFTKRRVLTSADTLDGGTVLPGFTLKVAELFARLASRS